MGSSPATEKSISDSSLPTRIASMRNSRAVRWYVLALPSRHRGSGERVAGGTRPTSPEQRAGIRIFRPDLCGGQGRKRRLGQNRRPLLYNYVFVRSSENEIYKMMSTAGLSLYTVSAAGAGRQARILSLPLRRSDGEPPVGGSLLCGHSPGLYPEPKRLMKGDRVRITEGKFKNAEATVISQPGGGRKDIMVCVENWL